MTGDDGHRGHWGWDGRVSLPSSTLWVRADIVNVDDTAGEGVSDLGLHDGGCLPVMLLDVGLPWCRRRLENFHHHTLKVFQAPAM